MEFDEALSRFKAMNRQLGAYRHALGALNYDAMTAAPKNSAKGRAETCAILSGGAHKLMTSPEYAEAVSALLSREGELDGLTKLEAKEAFRRSERLRRIPADVLSEHNLITGRASAAWREAKNADDFGIFEPYLGRVFESAARIARIAAPGKDPYDYWLDENEEGSSQRGLDGFFAGVKGKVAPLIRSIAARPKPETGFLSGFFPIAEQRRFSEDLMRIMGIDRDRCTIAEVEHPYTTALNNRDVRITTHYFEDRVTANMFSVLHEGGHAIYEMGISDELMGSPLAAPASAGMHEAQSRFYENIIGRSRAFSKLILPVLQARFPQLSGVTEEEFYRAVNAVEPTLKRTEADELTYCLHIMVRYELEKKLLHGELEAASMPREWNRLYGEYLGIEPATDREGCLQDMHWGSGLIGYFSTYALGNAYGAQLYSAIRRELDVDSLVRVNDIPAVTAWLNSRIHRFGRTKNPAELLESAAGRGFEPEYYFGYLKEKYSELYGLE